MDGFRIGCSNVPAEFPRHQPSITTIYERDCERSSAGWSTPGSLLPVFEFEAIHTAEFGNIPSDQGQRTGNGLPVNQKIVRADWNTPAFKVSSNPRRGNGIAD